MNELCISEIFESIQGETSFTGCLTSFVRLAGCPLRCSWCDSRFSYTGGEKKNFFDILYSLERMGWNHVCVTGGEPLAQPNSIQFLELLLKQNYTVTLETNGSIPIDAVPERVHTILDVKCPGSGMSEKNHWQNLCILRPHDEVKFVIVDKNDFDWAMSIITDYNLTEKVTHILMSPAWNLLQPKELIEWMLQTKKPLRLNLQTHKYAQAK